MKNKHLFFLFTGLSLCSISLGLGMKEPVRKEAQAKESDPVKLEYDEEGRISIGGFPTNYNKGFSDIANGNENLFLTEMQDGRITPHFFTMMYQNREISFYFTAHVDSGGQGEKLSDGTNAGDVNGHFAVFDYEPIKWIKYDEGKDYVDFIADLVLFRAQFHNANTNNLKYTDSELFEILNGDFINFTFNEGEREYLSSMEIEGKKDVKVSLPETSKVQESNEPKCSGATDYAKCDELSGNKRFEHCPYWTRTGSNGSSNRKDVKWHGYQLTGCLLTDNKIGVRPIIRINSNLLAGGSKSSSKDDSKKTTEVNTPLILGIITGVLGAGALVAFFIMWSKKLKANPSFKAPGWYYAIIFVAAACCAVSVISFSVDASGGGEGGSGCFVTGYYVQTGRDSGTSGGIDYVQVGSTAWLIRADGTASYTGYLEDTTNASDFSPDNHMTGTYKITGSKLVITIPETYINNFGTIGGTFTYTIKNCKCLYSGSTEAYHWVRGE